jgi:hypothetical protein
MICASSHQNRRGPPQRLRRRLARRQRTQLARACPVGSADHPLRVIARSSMSPINLGRRELTEANPLLRMGCPSPRLRPTAREAASTARVCSLGLGCSLPGPELRLGRRNGVRFPTFRSVLPGFWDKKRAALVGQMLGCDDYVASIACLAKEGYPQEGGACKVPRRGRPALNVLPLSPENSPNPTQGLPRHSPPCAGRSRGMSPGWPASVRVSRSTGPPGDACKSGRHGIHWELVSNEGAFYGRSAG